jgi:hypothetical protein
MPCMACLKFLLLGAFGVGKALFVRASVCGFMTPPPHLLPPGNPTRRIDFGDRDSIDLELREKERHSGDIFGHLHPMIEKSAGRPFTQRSSTKPPHSRAMNFAPSATLSSLAFDLATPASTNRALSPSLPPPIFAPPCPRAPPSSPPSPPRGSPPAGPSKGRHRIKRFCPGFTSQVSIEALNTFSKTFEKGRPH